MSFFPSFSNIDESIRGTLDKRKGNPLEVSKLNVWVKLTSAVGNGLVVYSNPDYKLFNAAGDGNISTIYGSNSQSGVLGVDWDNNVVYPTNSDLPLQPRPAVTSIEIDEGAGNISRKATISMTAFTKGQTELLSEYFLEPGYTVFFEFGWNTPKSAAQLVSPDKPDAISIAKMQNMVELVGKRNNSEGTYENYLGYITGGSISIEGTVWNITINLTGFTDIPLYLKTHEGLSTKEIDGEVEKTSKSLVYSSIKNSEKAGTRLFKRMFNELPTIRQIHAVKDLEEELASELNFINFDDKVRERINDKTDGLLFGFRKSRAKAGNTTFKPPTGTEIVDEDKFIRFSAMMKILQATISTGFKLGDKEIQISINSTNPTTIISAFPKIFSLDKSKLFIPNSTTPKISLGKTVSATELQSESSVSTTETNDNSVKPNEEVNPSRNSIVPAIKRTVASIKKILFGNDTSNSNPQPETEVDNTETQSNIVQFPETNPFENNKDSGYWGYLDNLYVNFNFFKNVISTPNFDIRNVLYTILNGLSSAAGNIWDFQIQTQINNEGNTVLTIVDMNFTEKTSLERIYEFDLMGEQSIFIANTFEMDISGQMMNHIIGKRIGVTQSDETDTSPSVRKGIFTDKDDRILPQLQKVDLKTNSSSSDKAETPSEEPDEQEIKDKNLQLFMDNVGIFSRVNDKSLVVKEADLEKLLYFGTYNDKNLFNQLRNSTKISNTNAKEEYSILLPIKFSFKIHGISGIKRGDKFKVRGLPEQYSKNGFFQVTAVKHTVSGMKWETDVDGSYRNSLSISS